ANSTLDLRGANAAFTGLSIGSNMLSVSGTAGATLSTGPATLTGNPTFDTAPNTTLALGALADGGAARTLAKTGIGTVSLNAAATLGGTGSLQAFLANGTVAPGGVSSAGTLTAASATFNSGSTLAIRIPSISAGQFSLLNMSAGTGTNLTINSGAILQLNLAG